MNKIKPKNNSRYFFIIALIVMVVFVLLILRPFLITIITSGILAYIFYPIYKRINNKLKRKNLSALISTLLVIIVIALPLIFAMNALTKEARVNYLLVKQKIITGEVFSTECDIESPYCKFSHNIRDMISDPNTKYYLDSANEKVSSYIVNSISNFLFSIPIMFLNIFIMFFSMFYFFKDGSLLFKKIERLSPLKKSYYKRILKKFTEVTQAIVFGYLLIALIEGFLAAIALFILGVKAPLFLGLIIAFLALVPIVGPPLVWLPVAIMMIIEGYTSGTSILITKGVILIIYGALIITPIDTILKPKVIGDRAKVHPILILLGILGGLKLFGIIGVIVGPLILSLFMTLLKIYEEEKGVIIR